MQYLEALLENQRLIQNLSSEPIVYSDAMRRSFAATFRWMTRHGDITHRVDGVRGDGDAERNYECLSWMWLSRYDRELYDRCRERILRTKNGWEQPHLAIGSHAALIKEMRLIRSGG